MKKITQLLLFILAAITNFACNPTDPEPLPPTPPTPDLQFTISVSDLTANSVKVTYTPSLADELYYYVTLSSDAFESLYQSNVENYLAEEIERYGDIPITEAMDVIAINGIAEQYIGKLTPETKYLSMAFGVNLEGEVTTDITKVEFFTLAENKGFTVSIELSDIKATSAKALMTPSDPEQRYFYNLISAEDFEQYHSSDAAVFMENLLSDQELIGDRSIEEFMELISTLGSEEFQFSGMTQNTDYVVFAIGVNLEGEVVGEMTTAEFKTLEATSSNQFSVEFFNYGYDGVDFTITPVELSPYFYTIKSKSWVEAQSSDQDIISLLQSEFAGLIDYLYSYSGEQTYTNEGVWGTDTGYYVLIFGYESGAATTPLSKFEFRTLPSATTPADVTYSLETQVVTARSVNFTITPSDRHSMYIWDVTADADFEALKNAIDTYIDDAASNNPFGYDGIRTRGKVGSAINRTLQPSTEYVVWAAAVDEYGEVLGEVKEAGRFQTLASEVGDANVVASFTKYFDGDELYAYDPVRFSDTRGSAYIYVEFDHGNAVEWWGAVSEGDLSDMADQEIIDILTGGFGGIWAPVAKPFLCRWDTPHTVLAVGIDNNDNFGNLNRSVHTFTKEGAAPVEEIEDVLPKP